ncbi:MAG: hypothetical protein SPI35_08000 [Porphyromonas sp.]|nr:hypothetical protein [Porphyromonas sp.]
MGSKRKLQRRNSPRNYNKMCESVSEQAIYHVLAVAVDVLWNDFGGLQRKATRLKFFADTFRERLGTIDGGFTPSQQAAMDELERQAGYRVIINQKNFKNDLKR